MASTSTKNCAAVAEDRWLSSIFGHAVFKVAATSPSAGLAEDLSAHAEQQTRAMYFAKVDANCPETVGHLEAAGMRVVDVNVTLSWICAEILGSRAKRDRCQVREFTAADDPAVADIARTCFRFSRFHLDPDVSNEVADEIKRSWIQSYLQGARGDRLFVAHVDGRPAGFLAALATNDVGVIDLVGVSNEFQRCGVGTALVDRFIQHYQNRCRLLKVGTQIANVASLRLYQRTGFQISDSTYVLHMHV